MKQAMRSLGAIALALITGACSGEVDDGTGGMAGSSGGAGASGGAGGSGGSNGGTGGSNGEPAELAGTLAAHNSVRAAKGIAPLAWDPALAKIAHDWVSQCRDTAAPIGLVDHNAGRSSTYPEYVGENIYASSGTASGPNAVSAWASEEADYDYASNRCAAGAACGHYTQIVWAKTTKVGCAVNRCSGLRYPSTLVCNYAPGGNIQGQKPY